MDAFVILFCLGLFLVLVVKVVNRSLPDPKETNPGHLDHEVKRGEWLGGYAEWTLSMLATYFENSSMRIWMHRLEI